MNASTLTDPQKRALRVLAGAVTGEGDRRPVRTSNRTTTNMRGREMLTIHRTVAFQLVDLELVRVLNSWLETLELTPAGHELAQELGL